MGTDQRLKWRTDPPIVSDPHTAAKSHHRFYVLKTLTSIAGDNFFQPRDLVTIMGTSGTGLRMTTAAKIPADAVDDAFADVLRKLSPCKRIQIAAEANDMARLLVAGGIRFRHPEWSEAQVQREVARRMLDATD